MHAYIALCHFIVPKYVNYTNNILLSEHFAAEKQRDDEDVNSAGEENFGSDETAKLDQPRGMLLLAAGHLCQGQPCSMYTWRIETIPI